MPRRGAYGSLGMDKQLVAGDSGSSVQRAGFPKSYVDCDPETSGPFSNANVNAAPSPGNARWQSWWSAGVVIAAAATALSAVLGLVHVANISGITQLTPRSNQFEDMASEVTISPGTGDLHKSNPAGNLQSSPPSVKEPTTSGRTFANRESQQPELVTNGDISIPEDATLSFIALNDYTRRGDVVGEGYPWLEGNILVEPFRDTSLEVVDPVEGMIYVWSIVETRNSEVGLGEFTGDRVTVMFRAAPEYTVALLEVREEDKEVSRMVTVDVFCKYVRREIRSLLDSERDEMFDAMKVLWDVSVDEGKKLYGDNYLDIYTIDEFHQIGASDLVCDHLHDGIGFGISHSMVTIMFEDSLRLVNPKLSLAYWDFTIDAYLVDKLYAGDYSHLRDVSDLWTPEWFGGVDPVDFQVKDGRWANLSVPLVSAEKREAIGADVYGRMRSPWNVNDRKYLTRGLGEMCGIDALDFYSWPTCKTHYELQAMYTSYYGYTWHSQYGPHGPTHIWIGGTVDCKENMAVYQDILGDDEMVQMTGFAFIERKDLFRDGLFKCREVAHEDMPARAVMEEGMCGCLDLDLNKPEDYLAVYEIFASGYDIGELSDDDKKVIANQYCNGLIGIGESSQSSSPLDPTFWSLHPTMERLLMFKRMTGTMTDLSWPDEVGTWIGEDGLEYDVVISIESDDCVGHRGSDVFPYGILSDTMDPQFTFWGKTGSNTINNRDMVHLFDPRVNALPYIYDTFKWDHCTEIGVDMDTLFGGSDMSDGKGSPKIHGYSLFSKGAPIKPLYETTNPHYKKRNEKEMK